MLLYVGSCPDDCTSEEHGTCDTETGECHCNYGYDHPSDDLKNCAGTDYKNNEKSLMTEEKLV